MQAATRRQRSTTSPASQRRNPHPKTLLCVGVMEREKWRSLRDGEESIRGGKYPPSGASSPADPHRHPRYPKSAQGGGPRPIRTRAHGSPARPTRPHSRGKTTHPIIQSVPKLHKTIRHPGKARLPTSIGPPLRRHRCIEDPHTRAGPSACTNPCSRRHTNQDPSPPGPAGNPNPEAERPQIPKPPPRTNSGTVRPPGWQPTSAGTGIPSSAACAARETAIQSHQYPIQAKVAAPSAEPPKKPTPQGTPRCPRPILPPHANHKNHSRTESGPPPTLGDASFTLDSFRSLSYEWWGHSELPDVPASICVDTAVNCAQLQAVTGLMLHATKPPEAHSWII